jgi:hypothetical protein
LKLPHKPCKAKLLLSSPTVHLPATCAKQARISRPTKDLSDHMHSSNTDVAAHAHLQQSTVVCCHNRHVPCSKHCLNQRCGSSQCRTSTNVTVACMGCCRCWRSIPLPQCCQQACTRAGPRPHKQSKNRMHCKHGKAHTHIRQPQPECMGPMQDAYGCMQLMH